MILLTLGPQIILWYDRGKEWQGACATLHADEYLYSAYLRSLVDGRPRRNDPFTGRPDSDNPNLPETAFSIQFLPPYALVVVAKLLGGSVSLTFIALSLFGALTASLALYWLLGSLTGNARLAATGTLLVLTGGTICGAQGAIAVLLKLDGVALGLPFLRRYQPAAAFSLLFVFCTLVWLALNTADIRKRLLHSAIAGLLLVVLTFSYLYLWTAAIAWLACFAVLWLVFRWSIDARRMIHVAAVAVAIFAVGLFPYNCLLSHRSITVDELQTMISTHRLDLFRVPEVVGMVVLLVLAVAVFRGRLNKSDPQFIFAAATALLPIVVFNQQVLTGKSIQPFHFEAFIVNYVVLVAVVVEGSLVWRPIKDSTLSWITIACLVLGLVDVAFLAAGFHHIDVLKDRMVPVARRLRQLSTSETNPASTLVFSPHLEVMQMLPAYAPQGTLLGMGSVDFGGATPDERKEFLFTHLYYSGVTPDALRQIIDGAGVPLQTSYYVKYVLFGHERIRPVYSLEFQPITPSEIEDELNKYAAFVDSFSRDTARKHRITYSVTTIESNFDFSYIDRWYERSRGEQVGEAMLYTLRLRE
jgi:hypothetical protein